MMLTTACDTSSKWKTEAPSNQNAQKESLTPYQIKVQHFRDSTSAMFLSGANGVLEKKDISPMGKLHYYPADEEYRVAATFTPIENGQIFEMQTNTDRLPEYKRYGKLTFTIDGEPQELTLYQNVDQPDYLFLPFKDLTNGNATYGAGRYLDFSPKDLENLVIDFNYSYNPYCAYNKAYSCPIPPIENHLQVAIEAGEKKWH